MYKNIENIIFDLGGVILDIDINKAKEELRKLGLEEIDDLFGLGHAGSFFKDHEQGKISDDEFVDEIHRRMKGAAGLDEIRDAWNSMLLKFPPERIEFLQELKSRFRLFLFSNTNGIHLEAFRKLYNNSFEGQLLDDLFEKAYYSHLMQLRKPDKKSFEYIINDQNLDPARTLFIDDAEINVKGAIEAGLQGLHLKKGERLEELTIFQDAS